MLGEVTQVRLLKKSFHRASVVGSRFFAMPLPEVSPILQYPKKSEWSKKEREIGERCSRDYRRKRKQHRSKNLEMAHLVSVSVSWSPPNNHDYLRPTLSLSSKYKCIIAELQWDTKALAQCRLMTAARCALQSFHPLLHSPTARKSSTLIHLKAASLLQLA